MPVARLETGRATFTMKTQFDGIDSDWTVSVIRDRAERLPLYGLIDEDEELTRARLMDSRRIGCFPATRQARPVSR